MNIDVNDEWRTFINEQMNLGNYASQGDVIVAALSLMQKSETPSKAYVAWLNQEIDRGLSDVHEGRVTEGAESYQNMQGRMNDYNNA